MWPESSSVNAVNLVKKICYNFRDIEFFLGDYFFGAPCTITALSLIFRGMFTICSRMRCEPVAYAEPGGGGGG